MHCERCHRPLPHNADEQRACDVLTKCRLQGEIHDPHPLTDAPWCDGVPDPDVDRIYATSGEQVVILRRLDVLKERITEAATALQFYSLSGKEIAEQLMTEYDRVHRAVTKAYRLPR